MLPTRRLPLESSFRPPRLSRETEAVRPRAPLEQEDVKQGGSAPSWDQESASFIANALQQVGVETRLSARDISAQVERECVKALSKRDPSAAHSDQG